MEGCKSGKYDNLDIVGCNNRILSTEKPDFYDEFPDKIKEFYPINIDVSLYESNKNSKASDGEIDDETQYIFTIEDRGCGISIKDLKRMENVGGSWAQDDELQDFIENMPLFLQPTGSFGIGLHSVFMVTDEIFIETKSEDDKAYDISFVSRRKNGYITVKENKIKKTIGTKITVKLKQSKLDLIVSNLSSKKSSTYDFLDERFEINRTFDYFRSYIEQFISNINMLKIKCSINNRRLILSSFNTITNIKSITKPFVRPSKTDNLIYSIYLDEKLKLKVYIKDKKYGTTLNITLVTPNIQTNNLDNKGDLAISLTNYRLFNSTKICYKEISCDSSINNVFFKIIINLFHSKAKDILDVSRKKLEASIYMDLNSRLNKIIIPELFNYIFEFLTSSEITSILTSEKDNILLKASIITYTLASYVYLNKTSIILNDLESIKITNLRKIDKLNKKLVDVTLKDFISTDILYLTSDSYLSSSPKDILTYFENIDDDNIILMTKNIFYRSKVFITNNFALDKYVYSDSSNYIVRLKKQPNTILSPLCITTNKHSNLNRAILFKLDPIRGTFRYFIPAIKYLDTTINYDCIIVNDKPNHIRYSEYFNDFEYLIKHSIISPISKPLPYEDLRYDSEKLKAWIKEECNFDKLVDYVLEHSVIQPNDKENIEKTYMSLIDDFVESMIWMRDQNIPEPPSTANDSLEILDDVDSTNEEVAYGVGESEEVNVD